MTVCAAFARRTCRATCDRLPGTCGRQNALLWVSPWRFARLPPGPSRSQARAGRTGTRHRPSSATMSDIIASRTAASPASTAPAHGKAGHLAVYHAGRPGRARRRPVAAVARRAVPTRGRPGVGGHVGRRAAGRDEGHAPVGAPVPVGAGAGRMVAGGPERGFGPGPLPCPGASGHACRPRHARLPGEVRRAAESASPRTDSRSRPMRPATPTCDTPRQPQAGLGPLARPGRLGPRRLVGRDAPDVRHGLPRPHERVPATPSPRVVPRDPASPTT